MNEHEWNEKLPKFLIPIGDLRLQPLSDDVRADSDPIEYPDDAEYVFALSGSGGNTYNISGSGGIVCGGSFIPGIMPASTGGLVCGGSSPNLKTCYLSGSGGIVCGGNSSEAITEPSTGGVVCGGSATVRQNVNLSGKGGAIVGGSSVAVFGVFVPSMRCGCNLQTFTNFGMGGATCGGSSIVRGPEQSKGGAVLGGSALVDNLYDLYDRYAAVWPLSESGNGTPGEFHDLTRHHLDGTGGPPPTCPFDDAGIACLPCQTFSGRQFISFPKDSIGKTGFTIYLWGKIGSFFKSRTFFTRGFSTTTGDEWCFTFGHSFLNQVTASINSPNGEFVATGPTQLKQDWWYLFAAVWVPGQSLSVYVDGVLEKSIPVPTASFTPSNGSYASRYENGGYMIGSLQEIRLSTEALDATTLKAIHDAYCGGSLVTVGPEETFPF